MDGLVSALNGIAAWHWLVLGLVLLTAELLTGTSYLLWAAAAAWLVGLVMLVVPLAWPGQLAAFGLITIVSAFTIGRHVRGRWPRRRDAGAVLNDKSAHLRGALAQADGDFVHGRGRLRLGDSVWEGQSTHSVQDGDRVEVLSVEGATLIVRKVPTEP